MIERRKKQRARRTSIHREFERHKNQSPVASASAPVHAKAHMGRGYSYPHSGPATALGQEPSAPDLTMTRGIHRAGCTLLSPSGAPSPSRPLFFSPSTTPPPLSLFPRLSCFLRLLAFHSSISKLDARDTMASELSYLSHARYGKDKVRVLRVVREGSWHTVVEYNVKALVEGEIETRYRTSTVLHQPPVAMSLTFWLFHPAATPRRITQWW